MSKQELPADPQVGLPFEEEDTLPFIIVEGKKLYQGDSGEDIGGRWTIAYTSLSRDRVLQKVYDNDDSQPRHN
jgi:hypothetical protein